MTVDLWQAVDETVRLDPDELVDWEAVDQATQKVHGDLATWWTQATAGVNYYRADMPAKHLPGRTVRFNETDVDRDGKFRRLAGASVWMFPGNDVRAIMMATQHLNGTRVFVEVDDNYTRASGTPVHSSWETTRKRAQESGAHNYETHRKIVQSKACHGVIVSTPKLADVYSSLHSNIHVCPNSVDPDDWAPDPPHQADGVLRVGWAGSASHGYDLNDIRRALDWASRQRDVEVVLFGQLSLPIRHRNIPWMDKLAEYRQNVQQIDVMLCPLRPNPWADCKSDIKALEAAMGGACSIVSRTEPFRPWWSEDRPCYVADDDKGFLRMVKHVVANREETRETARLAYEYARTERSIHKSIRCWREALL